jgi:hypothetical protein
VINIGTRQDGRIFPKGVFCVDFKEENIISAISLALETYTGSERIYGIPGNISEKICQLLTNTITKDLIYKKFYD